MHAIRKLRESGHATVADYEKLLAPNVVFHSPVLIRTMEGRAVVAKIFATSTTLREGAYTGEWKLDDRRTLLRWKGKIQGHELESFDIIEENDEGLIVDRTIAFRPMPAAKLFRDAMRAAMGSDLTCCPDRNAEAAVPNSNPHASQDQELGTDLTLPKIASLN